MNGVSLHGGLIPYGGTFLMFSEYARNAIRMAALMGLRCIYVLTHDSIGLGEDGPTHQPVEHPPPSRLMPNVHVFRPCGPAMETAGAWQTAVKRADGTVAAGAVAAEPGAGAVSVAGRGRPTGRLRAP